ncbi:hypothetical protein HanXRQr2_Chr16g0744691 [Helianthus annuus]|uniref:Uncharacterized protein n=1 Tax=Helianthus annuus TaxID=4232 RepID=A0A9K3DQX9_HELAN|nr:hypothetical protein HanXRQr2_Chr16g0744691 [Helianthus annuus]KAJ0820933.1 hypothetical protein HanPSC8_Chr16g0713981 [Helianthus annuus]
MLSYIKIFTYRQSSQTILKIMHDITNQAFLVHKHFTNLLYIKLTLTGCEEEE